MLGKLATKIFGSRNERTIRQLSKTVSKINALESTFEKLTDAELSAKTDEFRQRLKDGQTLDDLLIEAFATVREASKRVLGMRHFDVQLIGGMVLHMGKIAEMRTGEGKTIVATLAVYLNALEGRGVHVVTVNDYLARRDGEELGRLYGFLGLTTGIIVAGMSNTEKQAAYQADITYGTNNEFGFDYLRTNMALQIQDRLQRELNFAIVDEVDSILIDEARTPLIISGPAEMDTALYQKLDALVPQLNKQDQEEEDSGDFTVDEKTKQIGLTERGHEHIEQLLIEHGLLGKDEHLYDPQHIGIFHHLNACLRAHYLYHKDVDYIVRDDEVIIIDEFTGRSMEGRRWSGGLHQAIEIKENVSPKQETQTLATITYQNFFRLYSKLAGMTGTADTEAFEFQDIYNLETVVIPTNLPIQRRDYTDLIYLRQPSKYRAIVADVKESQQRGQPVLLGTASIETSELLSNLLKQEGIKHEVLNAKQHAREAEIIANAGRPGQVTIATNMAGRGTDIVLGGNLKAELAALPADSNDATKQAVLEDWQQRHDAVIASGGLHVIGAERHESRRIDNQLRGRSGRQGDPGSSRFYVALDDNLVRIFAGERMSNMMQRVGMKDDEALESKIVSRQIESAQRKVEAYHFDARKNILEYDNIASEQRKVIYQQRSDIIEAATITDMIQGMRKNVVDQLVARYLPADQVRQNWDVKGLEQVLSKEFSINLALESGWLADSPNLTNEEISDRLVAVLEEIALQKRAQYGDDLVNWSEKFIALQVIDEQWRNHLNVIEMLRQSIWMRARAQKDPKREYQRESFELFSELLNTIQFQIVRFLAQINFHQVEKNTKLESSESAENSLAHVENNEVEKIGKYGSVKRNEQCPCGSGKKYKQCHGKLD